MERDTQRFEDLASVLSLNSNVHEDDLKKVSSSLSAFRSRPVPPLVVFGKTGSSKSALVAHWLRTNQIVTPGSLIFYHSAVFSSASADPTRALRRLVSMLQNALGWGSTKLPTELSQVSAMLPELILNVAAQKSVIIILDGFDVLMDSTSSSYVKWLPTKFPANTLVILTSGESPRIIEMMQQYQWQTMEVGAVSLQDKGAVIGKILAQQSKQLSKDNLRMILTSELTNEHLFLTTLVEDLCSVPADKMDHYVVDYLKSRNTHELFLKITKRLEVTYTPQLIEGILKRTCVSRHGLSKRELLAMMQLEKIADAPTFEKAWAEMEHLFLKTGDLYIFANEIMKDFVEQIFLSQTKSVEAVARKIANFFEKLLELQRKKGHVDERVLEELPYALVKTGDMDWLKDILLDANMFLKLSTTERMYELRDFWKHIGTTDEMSEEYCEMLLAFATDEDKPSNEILISLFDRIAEVAIEVEAYQYALFISEKGVEFKIKLLSPRHLEVGKGYFHQGLVYKNMKKYEKAIQMLTLTLEIYDETTTPGVKTMVDVLTQLAECYTETLQHEKTIPLYARCSTIQKKALGPYHPSVAQSLKHLADTQELLGQYEKAEVLYQHCLGIQEHTLGKDHPEVCVTLNKLGLLYQRMGSLDKGNETCARALLITEASLGKDHPDVATIINLQAKLLEVMGKYDQALPLYQRALDIRERYFGSTHLDVATTLNNLGVLYFSMGRLSLAESAYKRALDIRDKILGMEHPSVANVLNNLGVLFERNQNNEEALEHHNQALSIQERHLGKMHPDIATTLNNKAVIAEKVKDYETANQLYLRALAIQEKAVGPDHPDVAVALNNQGALLKKMGRGSEAMALFERAYDIVQRALGPSHHLALAIMKNRAELGTEQPSAVTPAPSASVTGSPISAMRRDSQESVAPTRTFLSGELFKKSGFADRWRKRLFFLNKTRLEWYEDNESMPKNFVLFANILAILLVDEVRYKRKFVFEVVTADHTYALQAENEENMTEWVDKLKKAIKK